MFKDTFWSQLLAAFVMMFSLPLVVIMIPVSAVIQGIKSIGERRRYKESNYFLNFGVRYHFGVTNTAAYRFYEAALSRGLVMEYYHLPAQSMDLFLYEGCVYILPDFDSLLLDEEDSQWMVNRDGNVRGVEEEMPILCASLEEYRSLPKKILVEQEMIPIDYLRAVALPEHIFLVESYESAFVEETL